MSCYLGSNFSVMRVPVVVRSSEISQEQTFNVTVRGTLSLMSENFTFSTNSPIVVVPLQLTPRKSAFSRPNRPPPLSGIKQDIGQVRSTNCIETLANRSSGHRRQGAI